MLPEQTLQLFTQFTQFPAMNDQPVQQQLRFAPVLLFSP